MEQNPDIFLLKRDWGDLILIMKGETSDYLEEERDVLLDEIHEEIAKTRYQVTVGVGSSKNQIEEISQSFIEALVNIQNPTGENKSGLSRAVEQAELLKVDKSAVENYLRSGTKNDFDEFFPAYLGPLGETALKSYLIRNYIFVDVVLAIARLVNDLGGEVEKVIPELSSVELTMSNIKSIEQLRDQVQKILCSALTYRDTQTNGQSKHLIRQAKEYLQNRYTDPELSLNKIAAQVNLSASHFSVVFSQETGQTFKEYLTEIRIKRISAYNRFQADEAIKKIEEGMKETKSHLKNLTAYAVAWFEMLQEKYGKGIKRRTSYDEIEQIDASAVVSANQRLFVSRVGHKSSISTTMFQTFSGLLYHWHKCLERLASVRICPAGPLRSSPSAASKRVWRLTRWRPIALIWSGLAPSPQSPPGRRNPT